jgi:pimeloyl-ACP methyl ester carboxylesterase
MATFALIPGAGGVAWYWHRVVPLLTAAGHRAIAVDLPGDDEQAGLPDYAAIVAAAVGGRDDVVLVAQSLGGFTAPLAAQRVPVRGLVFLNAMIPLPGETPGAWWASTGQAQARAEAAAAGGYGAEVDADTYFLHDVPAEVLAGGEGLQRDEADAAFGSACEFAGWPDVPIRVAAGSGDRFFPVEFQRRVAKERLGITADVLPGGHLTALSQPAALTDYLLEGLAG